MAEECVSVYFEVTGESWNYCWGASEIQPYWVPANVDTGLRKSAADEARAWKTCQYYLQKLPPVCKYFKPAGSEDGNGDVSESLIYACSYVDDNTSDNSNDPAPETPTGFNYGHCDYLGRRSWCTKYDPRDEEYSDWTCAAPNPYLTGVAQTVGPDDNKALAAVTRKNIWGFNLDPKGNGAGLCDCYGMGRGQPGCSKVGEMTDGSDAEAAEKMLSSMPVMCNFYKPWDVGFGSRQPQGIVRDHGKITQEAKSRAYATAWFPMSARLPLEFEMYNWRSKFQKCQWWDKDEGSQFILYEIGDDYTIILAEEATDDIWEGERVAFCTCTDSAAIPYNTRTTISGYIPGVMMTENILALGEDGKWGGYICNGARPECPCYSGKWVYNITEKMLPGMPITANQIFELRFHAASWETQEQYDEYFSLKPNREDPETASICTWAKWEHDGIELGDPLAITQTTAHGKEYKMCMPAPFGEREFIPEVYLNNEGLGKPITFKSGFEGTTGTTAPGQYFFPTLVRRPEFPGVEKPLFVLYPYYNDNIFTQEACENLGAEGHLKRNNSIYGDSISVIGHTIRNKAVYAMNMGLEGKIGIGMEFGLRKLREYSGMFEVPIAQKPEIYRIIEDAVSTNLADGGDFAKSTTSDDVFGYFVVDSVKLHYNKTNVLLICVDFGDGSWEFRWRTVESVLCGGTITQTSSQHVYEGGNPEEGYTNYAPRGFDPPPTMEFTLQARDGHTVPAGATPVVSYEHPLTSTRYHTYSIAWSEPKTRSDEDIRWSAVGNSNLIWAEIDDVNLNYVFNWKFIEATLTPKRENNDPNSPTKRKGARPEVMEEYPGAMAKKSIPPSAVLLKPEIIIDEGDDSHPPAQRVQFIRSEWELSITYRYQEMVEAGNAEGPVIWGAGASANSGSLGVPFTLMKTADWLHVSDITGTVALMAKFNDVEGRLIATMATKGIVNVVREGCRGVAIKYSYEADGIASVLTTGRSGLCVGDVGRGFTGEINKYVETPNCGDHLLSWWKWQGPMWFPYNHCRGFDMYDVFTICNNCQATYVGPMNDGFSGMAYNNKLVVRNDYRYCGPHKYYAWGEVARTLAACGCGCDFFFADVSSATPRFRGYMKRRGPVDPIWWAENDWFMPPYGNDGRELIEKFLSQDYVQHFTLVDPTDVYFEWMPMMVDNAGLYMSYNAFELFTLEKDLTDAESSKYSGAVVTNEDADFSQTMAVSELDPFFFVNQLSFFTLSQADETLVYVPNNKVGDVLNNRQSWEDTFERHVEGNSSYPPKTIWGGGNTTRNSFYYFKQPDAAWAWQEYWEPVERDLDLPGFTDIGTDPVSDDDDTYFPPGKLTFINEIKMPEYISGLYKDQHRQICDEGPHMLMYKGPRLQQLAPGSWWIEKYPTLSLDGENARPFEIIYNDYESDDLIDWKTEGGEANTDASGNTDDDSAKIYEEASGEDWIHSPDMLFAAGAANKIEDAEAGDRKVLTETDPEFGDTYRYYNRGIIVRVPRRSLDFLPKDTEEMPLTFGEGGWSFQKDDGRRIEVSMPKFASSMESGAELQATATFIWNEAVVNIVSKANYAGVDPFSPQTSQVDIAPESLIIRGWWGQDWADIRASRRDVYKPRISFSTTTYDNEEGPPRGTGGTSELLEPQDGQPLAMFEVRFSFFLGPHEMITNRVKGFTIQLAVEGGGLIGLTDIILVNAKNYKEAQLEHINVRERKYLISSFGSGKEFTNLDGTDDNLHYSKDFTKAGQYFDFRGSYKEETNFKAWDKLRAVFCDKFYEEDEDVPISYTTLHDKEATEQMKLYQSATEERDELGDELLYTAIRPPRFHKLDDIIYTGFAREAAQHTDLNVKSETLLWDEHYLTKQFKQYDYWRPGGHYYTWGDAYTDRCSVLGPIETVYRVRFEHNEHTGIGTPIAGPSTPVDPINSYYSLRFYTVEAKYERFMILSGGMSPDNQDLPTAANLYNNHPDW